MRRRVFAVMVASWCDCESCCAASVEELSLSRLMRIVDVGDALRNGVEHVIC
jgi:hypothetical protein